MTVVKHGAQAVKLVEIDDDQAGQRIDNFLLSQLKGVPKSRVYRILRKGEVRVNKGRIRPEYKLCAGDIVRIPPLRMASRQALPQPGQALRALLGDSVLFEDSACMVLNKPAGVAVHGGSGVGLGVIEALRVMKPEQPRLELVHRLDRDTSGCLLIACNRMALRSLQEQMRERSIDKHYLALVKGRWPKDLVEVNAPLQKNTLRSGERVVRPDQAGKRALTRFGVLDQFAGASLVEAELETGRTHQIRVHCQLAGHPLAGDGKYGDDNFNATVKKQGLNRLFLHASQLSFVSPASNKRISVMAPLPAELAAFKERLSCGNC